MWRLVKELSSDQRLAIESLVGRTLRDDEGVSVQPVKVVEEAPVDEAWTRAYQMYLSDLDRLAERTAGLPDDDLEALIEEARGKARRP